MTGQKLFAYDLSAPLRSTRTNFRSYNGEHRPETFDRLAIMRRGPPGVISRSVI